MLQVFVHMKSDRNSSVKNDPGSFLTYTQLENNGMKWVERLTKISSERALPNPRLESCREEGFAEATRPSDKQFR